MCGRALTLSDQNTFAGTGKGVPTEQHIFQPIRFFDPATTTFNHTSSKTIPCFLLSRGACGARQMEVPVFQCGYGVDPVSLDQLLPTNDLFQPIAPLCFATN